MACSNNCLIQLHPLLFEEGLSVTCLCSHQTLCSRGVHWLLTEALISCKFLVAIACSRVTASTFFPLWHLQQKVSLSNLALGAAMCTLRTQHTTSPHPAAQHELKCWHTLYLASSAEQSSCSPSSAKSAGLLEMKPSLTKSGLNYRSETLSRPASWAGFPLSAWSLCFEGARGESGERVGGKRPQRLPPSWGHVPLPYEKGARPCTRLPSYQRALLGARLSTFRCLLSRPLTWLEAGSTPWGRFPPNAGRSSAWLRPSLRELLRWFPGISCCCMVGFY